MIPRFKCVRDTQPSNLLTFINFFDETSNVSIQSFDNESEAQEAEQWATERDDDSDSEMCDSDSVEDETESTCLEDLLDAEETDIDNFGYNSDDEEETQHQRSCAKQGKCKISEVIVVSSGNSAASLLSIVAQHNGSDALLTDLLKRDHSLFGNQINSPWFLESKLEAAGYKQSHQNLDHGELIFLCLKTLLYVIIEKGFPLMLNYAEERQSSQDLLIPKFEIKETAIRVSLILNADGATVCKSLPLSAWPVFIADFPPFQRQRFKNLNMAAVYVGKSHKNFNIIFEFFQREMQKSGVINFQGRKVTVHLNPMLLIADLIGKATILNMEQCNGFYGCTL